MKSGANAPPLRVRDICAALEQFAPAALAYEWDKVGLSIGDPSSKVTGVVVALTVTRKAFQATRKAGAEMIVSHHPVIREPLRALRTEDPLIRLCLDLAQAGIACFAAHTNLDVVPGGVNDLLADKLGLVNKAPLLPVAHAAQVKLVTFVPESHLTEVRRAVCDAGAGVIGDYTYCSFSAPGVGTFLPGARAKPFSGRKHRVNEEPELRFETLVAKARIGAVVRALEDAHPYEAPAYDIVCLENRDLSMGLGVRGELASPISPEAFARTVRKALRVSHVRVVGGAKRRVRTVAVLGGGGTRVRDIPGDVDVCVTGDIRYHDALEAQQRGLALVDAGHAATEKWIVPALTRFLRTKFKTLQVIAHNEREIFRAIT